MTQRIDNKQALRMLPEDYGTIQVEMVSDSRTPEQLAEDAAVKMQAKTEGVEISEDRTIEFSDARFRIADKVGLMPLMQFAYHANSGMDTADMKALVAIYEMLKDCIHKDDWDKFCAHATKVKAEADELMDVVQKTIELLTARPTKPVSGSSLPPHTTSDSSTDSYSDPRKDELTRVADLGKASSL